MPWIVAGIFKLLKYEGEANLLRRFLIEHPILIKILVTSRNEIFY